MTKRATPQEILEFVNRLRVAGGFEPLDRLSGEAQPEDMHCCLIAMDVPGAMVAPADNKSAHWSHSPWAMTSSNVGILEELKLVGEDAGTVEGQRAYKLPDNIALAAIDFDSYTINTYGEEMEGDAE